MSINHSLDSISKEQDENLSLANTLLNNLNSLRPTHFNKNTLNYDGEKFDIIQTGFSHEFLVNDIKLSIEKNIDKHKNYIQNRCPR